MNKMLIPWGFVIASVIGIAYLVSDVILPFVIAFIIAYMLYPITQFLSKKCNISLSRSGIVIFVLFMSICATVITMIAPIIYKQISAFIKKLPDYHSKLQNVITDSSETFSQIDPNISAKISDHLREVIDQLLALFSSLINHIWDYTLATINFFTICVIVPFALFYFLRDWNKMTGSVDSLFPVRSKWQIQEIILAINQLLSDYIRGQLIICLMLSVYYIISFALIGLDFALLLGLCSGFLVLIPFIGTIIAFTIVMLSGYISFGLDFHILYIIATYIVAHFLEGYYLTPKIIGQRIGLHPLWIVFSVLVGANLCGILGIVIALPVAGVIKILWSHLLNHYKLSPIYRD